MLLLYIEKIVIKVETVNVENAGINDSKLFNLRLISSYAIKVVLLFVQCFDLESGEGREFSKPCTALYNHIRNIEFQLK